MTGSKSNEEYYKVYGESTGKLAATVKGEEEIVRQFCDGMNSLGTIGERITYTKIDLEEYKKINNNGFSDKKEVSKSNLHEMVGMN